MSDETAGLAVTISAELDRFERSMRQAGRLVETTADGMDKSTRRAARSFETLESKLDPAARAATRLDRDMRKVQVALEKGAIDTDRAAAAAARLNQQYEATIARTNALTTTTQRASVMSGRMGNAIQQAGFQVGDFAVQVASGQGVLRPFIQQGTQLVSMFGPLGAAVGAAGAVLGALAISFLDLGDSAEEGTSKVISSTDAMKKSLEGLNELRRETLMLTEKLAGAYRGEAEQAARVLVDNARAKLATAQAEADAIPASGGIRELGTGVSGQVQARLEDAQAELAAAEKRLAEIRDELDTRDAAERELQTRENLAKNTKKILEDAQKFEEDQAKKGLETAKKFNDARIREEERAAKELEKARQPKGLLKEAKAGQGVNSLTTGQASPDAQLFLDQVETRVAATRDRMAEATKRAEAAQKDLNQQVGVATGLLRQAQTPMDQYREQLDAIAAAEKEGAISAEQATAARQQAVENLNRSNPLIREAANGVQGLARELIDYGDSAESFGERASNAFRRLAERITETILELEALNPLLNEVFNTGLPTSGGGGGLFGDLFGGGEVTGAGTPINPDGGLLSFLFHKGGVVGDRHADRRAVPARAFAHAPRYHSGGMAGLRPDEVPAILQRGEEVITTQDSRHRFNAPRDPGLGLRGGSGGRSTGSTFIIDARGADPGQMAKLRQDIARLDGTIEQRSVSANVEAAKRAPGLFGGR